MKHLFKTLAVIITLIFNQAFAQNDTLVLRSEYEKTGDKIYDVNDPGEGTVVYSIISGNGQGYYSINASSGIITINNTIPDAFNNIHYDSLIVNASGNQYHITIADGYDYYLLQVIDSTYQVLDEHKAFYVDTASKWTAFNNLWGKGDAVPNEDFRISTICKTSLPDSAILMWDVPSKASEFGGNAVWCYNNVFWGNRKNYREDLPGFPFQIDDLEFLGLIFNFEQLYGNEIFKIAMNMFMTDDSILGAKHKGDFFFVFDQNGTYLPPYPYSLPDTIIEGKPFALLYDDENNNEFYERRRTIIKNNEKLYNGTLDITGLFHRFTEAGWLNPLQYISHIQLGVEVTKGFGAIRINHAVMTTDSTAVAIPEQQTAIHTPLKAYPNPSAGKIEIEGTPGEFDFLQLFDLYGRKINPVVVLTATDKVILDLRDLPRGVYIVKTKSSSTMVIRK
jgi:hypothetical protein